MEKRSQKTTPEDPQAPTRPDTRGTHVWWLINEEEVGSRRGVLVLTEIPPGRRHILHRHRNCEQATYVLSGSGLHLTVRDPVRQEAGEAVYVEPGEWHGFENDSDETVTLVMLYGGVGSREEAGYELFEAENSTDPTGSAAVVKKVPAKGHAGRAPTGVSWLVTSKTVGARSVALGTLSLAPGEAQMLHRHTGADEFVLLASGTGTYHAEDREVPLEEREAAYVPADEWHGLRGDPEATVLAVFGYLGTADPRMAGYEERAAE